jgi:hypothetical protein
MALSAPPVDEAPRAIETRYKGYRFRSRLEARWAVFFDALSVTWEYEKEGYDLGDSGWYLPDFWLPGLNMWVEVKPNAEAWTREATDKAAELCRRTELHVLAVAGRPDENMAELITPDSTRTYGVRSALVEWSECEVCKRVTLRPAGNGAVARAMDQAKAARFEFGEHG